MDLTPRQLREQETFDALVREKSEGKSLLMHTLPSFCDYNNDLFQEAIKHFSIPQKSICEIGCGNGEVSVWFALQGAEHIFGIDISNEAITLAKARSQMNNILERTTFIHAPGEKSTLSDDSIDIVFINVALHHLELPEALHEINRILKKGGMLIAIEPLVRSPFAQRIRTTLLFKKLFPIRQESRDERMLTEQDIDLIRAHFALTSLTSLRIFSPILFKIKPLFHGISRMLFWIKGGENQRKILHRWTQTCDAFLRACLESL